MKTRLVLFTFFTVSAIAFLCGCAKQSNDAEETSTEVAVQVGKVARVTMRARVDAYGIIEAEPAGGGKPAGAARLSTPTANIVMAVPVKEGERVEAGTIVVKLDDRVPLAQVEKATHVVEFADQNMARQRKLKAIDGTSVKTLQEAAQQFAAAKADLAAAQAQLAQVHLASPITGIVARINVQPGQTVEPGTVVAEIIDPARLVATVHLPVAEATRVKPGQPAELLSGQSGNTGAEGRVVYVSPQPDDKTATVLVRVSVPPEAGLIPGQFVHARIVTEEHTGRLAVPREAVYTDHDGQSTLSIVDGSVAKQRIVKVGLRDGNLVEVEGEGVTEGATVVTAGSYALPKETKVRILDLHEGMK
ncbi:MAG: efflux RND transporter periplasmic adaptor subunit [Verrucomicrobiota bacterium]|nr:efflux RND transporter periplasmic adaptor subunit [Verrucomicrobiota bacterium]